MTLLTIADVFAIKRRRFRTSKGRRAAFDVIRIYFPQKARYRLSHHLQESHKTTRKLLHADGILSHMCVLPKPIPLKYVDEDEPVASRVAPSLMWLYFRQPAPLRLAEEGTLQPMCDAWRARSQKIWYPEKQSPNTGAKDEIWLPFWWLCFLHFACRMRACPCQFTEGSGSSGCATWVLYFNMFFSLPTAHCQFCQSHNDLLVHIPFSHRAHVSLT